MAHIHEKIDITVGAYIVNGDAVLLRKHDKYKFWAHPGGHLELDEDPNQGVIREAKEETGLDITLIDTAPPLVEPESKGYTELVVPRFMNRHRINDTHEHIDLIYFATSKTRDVIQGDKEVSEEMRWFTQEDLDDSKYGLRGTVRHYAESALEVAKGVTK